MRYHIENPVVRQTIYIILILIMAVGAVKLGFMYLKPASRPIELLEMSAPGFSGVDPWKNATHHVVVYLAPWCHSCRKSLPFVREMRKFAAQNPAVGVKVIVGYCSKEEALPFAQEIGESVFYDVNDLFRRKYRFTAVPTWLLIDANGRAKKKMKGSPRGGSGPDHRVRFLLVDKFKLDL